MKIRLAAGVAAGLLAVTLSACSGTAQPAESNTSPASPASSAAAPSASPSAVTKPSPSAVTKPSVAATTPAAPAANAKEFAWKDITPSNDSPQAVTKKFLVGMYNKDVPSACGCFVPGLATTVCEPMLKQQIGSIPDNMNAMVEAINPTVAVTMSGDSAASVDLVMQGRSANNSKIKVSKQDGKWYISIDN